MLLKKWWWSILGLFILRITLYLRYIFNIYALYFPLRFYYLKSPFDIIYNWGTKIVYILFVYIIDMKNYKPISTSFLFITMHTIWNITNYELSTEIVMLVEICMLLGVLPLAEICVNQISLLLLSLCIIFRIKFFRHC